MASQTTSYEEIGYFGCTQLWNKPGTYKAIIRTLEALPYKIIMNTILERYMYQEYGITAVVVLDFVVNKISSMVSLLVWIVWQYLSKWVRVARLPVSDKDLCLLLLDCVVARRGREPICLADCDAHPMHLWRQNSPLTNWRCLKGYRERFYFSHKPSPVLLQAAGLTYVGSIVDDNVLVVVDPRVGNDFFTTFGTSNNFLKGKEINTASSKLFIV